MYLNTYLNMYTHCIRIVGAKPCFRPNSKHQKGDYTESLLRIRIPNSKYGRIIIRPYFGATNLHGRRAIITETSGFSVNSFTVAMNSSDWP